MKRFLILFIVVFLFGAELNEWKINPEARKDSEIMFVIHAESIRFEGEQMTLIGISENILYFSDRPERFAGNISVETLVKNWDKGEDSFAADNPNLVLSLEIDGKPRDFVLEVKEPNHTSNTLSFMIEKIIDGDLADFDMMDFENPVIFLDGHGCWVFGC